MKAKKSISQKTGLGAFIKEARKNRIWRYATSMLAVLVVFVTAYVLIVPGITLTVTDYASLEITDIEYDSVVYENGDYSTTMTLTFAGVDASDVVNNNYTYELVLPEYVVVDSSLMGGDLKGYDGTKQAFTYQYYYDDTTGRYYAIVVFDESYIASYSSTAKLNDGYIEFDATFSSSSIQEDGSIQCSYNEIDELTIPVSEITTSDSSYTPNADISVSKSSSGYDASTNSITYTVTVYSEEGTTSDISLEDVITIANSKFEVSSVTVDSVTYAAKSDAWSYGASSGMDSTSYSYNYDSSTGTLSMILPALADTDNESAYTITYTVYLNTFTDYSLTDTVNNTVKASATDTWKGSTTIYDTASKTTTVSVSLLSKSGSYDSSTGEITWTLVVNSSGIDIYGMTLTDEMFDGLKAEDLTVAVSGSGGRGNGYEFSYDSSDDLYITFGTVNGVASNTSTYTITYTTGSGLALGNTSNSYKENKASLVSDGTTVASGSASVYVYGGGSATKSLTDSTDNGDNTVTAEWKVSFSIPSGGVKSGTVLYDYLSSKGDYTSTTDQYFTYTQAKAVVDDYAYNLNVYDSSGTNTLTSFSAYTMAFYDQTIGNWVDYQTLTSGANTYSEDAFTAFRITFNSDLTLTASGTITMSYKSTIDVSAASATSDTYYYNRVYVNDSEFAEASYKNSANVTKMSDSGSTSDSTLTTTTGQVAWKVRVYIDEGSTETFTIVDTLPEGMELSAIYISTSDYYSSAMTVDGTTITGTLDAEVTGTIATDSNGQQVITLVVDKDAYASVSGTDGGGYIWIRYVTQMSDTRMTLDEGVTSVTYDLTNEVSVTKGTEAYGTSSQKQTVTYGSSSSSSDSEEVAKGYSWDYYNSEISYYVVLNPSAEDLLAGADTLTFTDVVSANFMEDWGLYLSLLSDSVHVYKAVAVTEGTDTTNLTVYTGGDGNSYIAGDEITVESLTYSQATTWSTEVTGTTTHTISGTVPDETAMIVVYSYYVNVVGSGGTLQSLYNKASLYGDSEYSYTKYTQESYMESNASAGIFGSESLTLTKVDSANLNTTLSGAVYELYWYTNGEWADTGLSFITEDDGSFSIKKSMLGNYYAVNTAYKLIETDAPDGYILDTSTEWDFYWYDSSTSTTSYPDGFTTQDDVYNLSLVSAQIIAPNTIAVSTTTSVTVEKEWVDADGNELADSEIGASEIELTLYRYEESDVAEEESETEDTETVTVYVYCNSSSTGQTVTVTKGEALTLVLDTGSDSATISQWSLYDFSSKDWSKQLDANWSVGGLKSCEVAISADNVANDLMINIAATSWDSGSVTVKGESTTISGVNSSGLPHGSNGDYAGTAIDTYTVTATNGWSLTVNNLPYEYYDNIGEKHTYYYYFVETAIDGYYTTYSSSTGVTDGGTFTVTNTKIPTTSIEVEKQWLDTDGSELTTEDAGYDYMTQSISVDLYRTEEVVDGSGSSDSDTVSLIIGSAWYWTTTGYTLLLEDYEIPTGSSVTINFGYQYSQYSTMYVSGWIDGKETSFGNSNEDYTITLKSDTIIILSGNSGDYVPKITYTGQDSSSDGGSTAYFGADLPTDGTYVGTYTIKPDTNGDWNLSISNLPGGYVDDEGTLHYYYYYVRESSTDLLYFDTTYSSATAVSNGTLTIYNTYNPNLKYTEAEVQKIWKDANGDEISSLSSYTATFQLLQLLIDTSTDSGYVESDGSVLMIPYRSPMTLTGSSSFWAALWVSLPTTATYSGSTYDCVYFIVETGATGGTDSTTFTATASLSTEDGSDSYTITSNGVTYYAVTVSDMSADETTANAPTVTITNTSSEEEKDSTSITVTKEWANVSDVDLNDYTVTFQLVQLLKASDDTYYSSGDDKVTNYSTEDVDGNPISYSYDMVITSSDSESYTWSSLPVTVTIDSVTYTCEYYIVESAVKDSSGNSVADQYTVTYSNSSATTYMDANATYYQVTNGGTATVTNTYSKEEETTISFIVTKNWEENGSLLQVSEVKLTVQLLQVLTADGCDPLYNKSDTSDIDYTKEITFTNSSTDSVTWSNLPATMTVNGVKYTCSYYIVEASVVNGSGTSVANLYTVTYANGSTDATSYTYNYTDASSGGKVTETYYAVSDGETITITNTAKNTAVLPSTGGSGSSGKMVLLGSVMALLALMLILARRRKRGGWLVEMLIDMRPSTILARAPDERRGSPE